MLAIVISMVSLGCNCSTVYPQDNVNLTEYARKTWYIQKQQITGYQKENQLYCVAATYNIDERSKVPLFNGKVLTVYNYANQDKVNGYPLGNNNSYLCARVSNNTSTGRLLVAPCFLPNIFGGPYWILYAGPKPDNYLWAIVIGGQPAYCEENTTCTTNINGINNSGLWLFSRDKILDQKIIDNMITYLIKIGISTDFLKDVVQDKCNYTDAFIK